MVRWWLALVFLVAISGCVPQQPQMSDYDRCSNFGFSPGTDPFAQCMMQYDAQRRELVGRMLLKRY